MSDKDPDATVAPQGTYRVPAADSLIGKFPNLEIEYLIGQGGMGAVYKARQTNLDRVVALKILSPQLGDDPTFAERFTREARTLAKLSHPNIVTVFDFGVTDSMHYLVMEYIDGVNLRDTILATDYSPAEALAVISQICDALQYAHDAGVVHRDIKPENILVDRNGVVKIADFGLAKLLSPTPEEFTLTGTRQVLGTLKYMAPEQIEKPEIVDHRADLYSLGVVFYELLTGELPIGRFAVPSAKAEINRRLDDVVLKTLEKEPDRRYQQASEIKTAVAAASLAARPEEVPVENPRLARHEAAAPKKSFAVPFTTDDIYGGMAEGYGIARLVHPDTLRIEIEVRDCFGATKLSLKTVDIPIEDLSSIRYRSGFFKDKITIQADSITAIGEVPSATHGSLNLYTKKADAALAQQLTMDIHHRLPSSAYLEPPFPGAVPTAPVKPTWNASTDDDYRHVTQQIRIPMVGLMITGILYLLAATYGTWSGDNDSLFWLPFGGAILMLGTSFLLWQKENYWLTMAGLILCCIPIHGLTVLSFIFGIWGLAIIDQPTAREVFHGPSKRFGVSPLLLGLVVLIPLLAAAGAIMMYWTVDEGGPAPNATTVTASVESSSDEETREEAATVEQTTVNAEVEPASSATSVGASDSEAHSVGSGYNNPGNARADGSFFTLRLGIILIVGLISGIAFLTVIGIILYLILRKPQANLAD